LSQLFQYSPTQSFGYVVKRQRRKTMALHVMPDASIEVRVPKWVPKREWIKFVEERADWVIEQQQSALAKLEAQPGYFIGQQHPYLGNKYPLHITSATRASAQLIGAVLHVNVRDSGSPEAIERVLEQWYRSKALTVFNERLQYCYSLFPDLFREQYSMPTLTLRKMRRRWGSCSSKGEITLNVHLIKAPLHCIDYVAVHELCHLAVFNHSPAFYRLMTIVMPDWKIRKKLLESQA
jgi:predicted metal-dependent hydrolase